MNERDILAVAQYHRRHGVLIRIITAGAIPGSYAPRGQHCPMDDSEVTINPKERESAVAQMASQREAVCDI